MTGPPEEDADEDRGARTLLTASLCLRNCRVRFLVAIELNLSFGRRSKSLFLFQFSATLWNWRQPIR